MKLRRVIFLQLFLAGLMSMACSLPSSLTRSISGEIEESEGQTTSDIELDVSDSTSVDSYPIESVELLYILDDTLYGFDMNDLSAVPVISFPQLGEWLHPTLSHDGRFLAYSDESGLHGLDLELGEEVFFLPEVMDDVEGEKFYPRAWSPAGWLLVDRWWGSGEGNFEPGWISVDEGSWHPILNPEAVLELAYYCVTGKAISPSGELIVISGQTHGVCGGDYTLAIISRDDGLSQRLDTRDIFFDSHDGNYLSVVAGGTFPAWSPDGEWIAFGMEDNPVPLPNGTTQFPTRLHLIHPDGSGLNPISTNTIGEVRTPTWAGEKDLYYGLRGDLSLSDGIYHYELNDRTNSLIVPDEVSIVGISPDGEYLLFWSEGLNALSLVDISVTEIYSRELGPLELRIVGWRSSE